MRMRSLNLSNNSIIRRLNLINFCFKIIHPIKLLASQTNIKIIAPVLKTTK